MPSEPAYLRNLKKYARVQFGDDELGEDLTASLNAESDRGAIILASTSMEDILEYSIGLRMRVLEEDAAARKEVFGADGAISTFSSKILIAYALGIIDRQGRKDIDLIRNIRNACAHSRRSLTLETPELVAAVKAAIGDEQLSLMRDDKPATLRAGFIIRCMMLSMYVNSGERKSPLELMKALSEKAQTPKPSPGRSP